MLDGIDDGNSDGDGVDDDFLLCIALCYASRGQKVNFHRGIGPKEIVT